MAFETCAKNRLGMLAGKLLRFEHGFESCHDLRHTNMTRISLGLLVGWALAGTATVADVVVPELPARLFPHPDRIRYDRQCLTIDGRDIFIYSGAFHYFRCPKELWGDRFQKIKAAGFNCVETYVAWNQCEPRMPSGTNDFSQVNLTDLDDWLTLAEQNGLYVIVRPGPYICAEWATGGFPEWLLTKKPDHPLRDDMWLRSDDPVFLAWSRHWFAAVCPVIARHQITRKSPGQRGVILVQVENEYDWTGFSDETKTNHVKALARAARAEGINVPLITCWTHQVRGSPDPVMREMFDCCNFYPCWNVEQELHDGIGKLRVEQPDAPLGTTELQGGQFAQVGGTLSEQQDGLTAAQINNLTLFAIQSGETLLNYYMLVGGSNFGDWAARDLTTTYDYNAPIREWGGIGDRYQRVWAIGHMLQEHGVRLARAEAVECDVTNTLNDVSVVERRAMDGSRYFFVRTSEHREPREGTVTVEEKAGERRKFTFNYQLEPFGAKILYLPPGVSDAAGGGWLPKPAPAFERPTDVPAAVAITSVKMQADPGPAHWTKLKLGESLPEAGVYGSGFLFYRTAITSETPADLWIEYPAGDAVLATIDGEPVSRVSGTTARSIFAVPAGHSKVELLYENRGFANNGRDMERPGGISAIRLVNTTNTGAGGLGAPAFGRAVAGREVPLEAFGNPAGVDRGWWRLRFKDRHWKTAKLGAATQDSQPLTWYRLSFQLPVAKPDVWVPWHVHLEAAGNGFLYLNGHAIGRFWQAGPQHDFFLPECWLNFGGKQENNLTLSLRPVEGPAEITIATVEPYVGFAEKR